MSVLTVGDHLRNLLGTYCERIDAGDHEGVGRLFARGELAAGDPDAPGFVHGADAIAAFYRRGALLHDGSPRTKHLVADIVLAEPAEDGSITVRSSYLVLQAAEGFPLQPLITGRYVDVFRHDPEGPGAAAAEGGADGAGSDAPTHAGGWYFARRHFTVDLVGDLSHHWAGPTG